MILTTTNSIQNREITRYYGIVTGTEYNTSYSYKGKKVSFKDMFNFDASKYYEVYSEGIENLKEKAFQKLTENAEKLGANAIVGISVDIETVANSAVMLVSITGTAVRVN